LEQYKTKQFATPDEQDTSFAPMEFIGRSDYCFAARLFQHFVQKDWTNSHCPVEKEKKRFQNQPVISHIPYDLRLFAPDLLGSEQRGELPSCIRMKERQFQLLEPITEQNEDAFWKDVILSEQNVGIISGVKEIEHAVKFAPLQTVVMQEAPLLDYIPFQKDSGVSESVSSELVPTELVPGDSVPDESVWEEKDEYEKCRFCKYRKFIQSVRGILNIFWLWRSSCQENECGSSHEQKKHRRTASDDSMEKNVPFDPFAKRKQDSSNNKTPSEERPKRGMMDDLED
ncbi:MAG: hypothetical protein Q4G59_00890, partial [Planctomycetia bacterium]|nr:hypothetical protein [Planctomycetia bacterium]